MKRPQIPVLIYAATKTAKRTPLVLTAEEKEGKAIIRIIGGIYEWQNSSSDFREKVEALQARGIKDAHVYIKSEGGDVFEANEIANIIESFEGTITGEGGSLVASAGTYIMVKLDSFKMPSNGQIMIHKPMTSFFGANEDEVESDLKLLKTMTINYAEAYSKKTGLSVDEIKLLWDKGDYWMDAKEAKEKGFIDVVEGEEEITASDVTLLRACGAPKVPTIETKIKNDNDMKISATALVKLGLTATATEQEIEDKINALEAKAAKYDTLKAETEAAEKTAKKAKIKAVIDQAIKDKKMTEDYRASFEAKLEANFDAASAEIEAMKEVKPVSAGLDGGNDTGIPEERKAWTYADWAEKDPKGLNEMPKTHPEAFKALYKGEYNAEAPKQLFE